MKILENIGLVTGRYELDEILEDILSRVRHFRSIKTGFEPLHPMHGDDAVYSIQKSSTYNDNSVAMKMSAHGVDEQIELKDKKITYIVHYVSGKPSPNYPEVKDNRYVLRIACESYLDKLYYDTLMNLVS